MSEMVERVARAICEVEKMNPDDALGGWVHWTEAARAAIEAMRNPTEAMELAFNRQSAERFNWPMMWAAAVDEALKVQP